MKNAEFLIGSRLAFRKIQNKDIQPDAYKQLINKALFVCCSVLLADYDSKLIAEKNNQNLLTSLIADKIESDKQLKYYLSYGTNGKANLLYTFNVLNELFKNNITY
jgi:Mor family transcriptional regulator